MGFLESLSEDSLLKVYHAIGDDISDLRIHLSDDSILEDDWNYYSDLWDKMAAVRNDVAIVYSTKKGGNNGLW